jgi:hypothetical protein
MVKVTISGKEYSFDNDRYSLPEAIEIERGTGIPFGVWRAAGLVQGYAAAMAGFAWVVLKRDGQDVPLADIMSGEYPLDIDEIAAGPEGDDDPDAGPTSPGSEPGETSGSPS